MPPPPREYEERSLASESRRNRTIPPPHSAEEREGPSLRFAPRARAPIRGLRSGYSILLAPGRDRSLPVKIPRHVQFPELSHPRREAGRMRQTLPPFREEAGVRAVARHPARKTRESRQEAGLDDAPLRRPSETDCRTRRRKPSLFRDRPHKFSLAVPDFEQQRHLANGMG